MWCDGGVSWAAIPVFYGMVAVVSPDLLRAVWSVDRGDSKGATNAAVAGIGDVSTCIRGGN